MLFHLYTLVRDDFIEPVRSDMKTRQFVASGLF
jgi:hypothetical protein